MISSHNVIHDNLLASSAFLQQLVTVIAQFHSGCALTIIKGLKSCRTSLKNDVCMIRAAAAEHTTPDRNARKAWHSYSYATGAYISVQSGIYIYICIIYISSDTCPQRGIGLHFRNLDLKPHEMNLTSSLYAIRVARLVAVLIICVCVIWSRRGCTRARDESHSRPGLIMSHHGVQ